MIGEFIILQQLELSDKMWLTGIEKVKLFFDKMWLVGTEKVKLFLL